MIKFCGILVFLINYKIVAIASASISATTEGVNHEVSTGSSTTEGLYISTEPGTLTTKGPGDVKTSKFRSASLILDDVERQILEIFVVNIVPTSLVTSAPKAEDGLSSVEMESIVPGRKLVLGRRTNFRTPLNCRCVIHNRCARSESCLKEKN